MEGDKEVNDIFIKQRIELMEILKMCCGCLFPNTDTEEETNPLLVPVSTDQTSMQNILQQTLDKLIDLNIYTIHSISRLSMYAPNNMPLGEKEIIPVQISIPNGDLKIGSKPNKMVLAFMAKALPILLSTIHPKIYIKELE